MRIDSAVAFNYTNRIGNLVNADRLPEARAAAELAVRRVQNVAGAQRVVYQMLYYEGKFDTFRHLIDSVELAGDPTARTWASNWKAVLSLREGRLADWDRLYAQVTKPDSVLTPAQRLAGTTDFTMWEDATLRGAKARAAERIAAALTRSPMAGIPKPDRPYFTVVQALAVAGRPEPARALLADYARETTDTLQRRQNESAYHLATGEVLLAERRFPEALTEFRRGDIGPDGWPANACVTCLPWDLARTFDTAGQADSAIVMYERVLVPNWSTTMDAVRVPLSQERLGALYESKRDRVKAAAHYREFVALWKNADAELQPRVAAARAAIKRLAEVEGHTP
jgi:tetratricopeptide (TPR) repeat protein